MLTAQASLTIPGNSNGENASLDNARKHMTIQQQMPDINVSNTSHQTTAQPSSRKDPTEVANKNNRILAKVCQDLNHFTTYGPAIDEFYHWCRDVRAYHPLNEQAILQCLEVIKRKAPNCGMWSALRVFRVAMSHKNRLSSQFDDTVSTWYEELKRYSPGYETPSNQVQATPVGSYYDTMPSASSAMPSSQINPQQTSPTITHYTHQFNSFSNTQPSHASPRSTHPPPTSTAPLIASSQPMQLPPISSAYSNSVIAPVNTPSTPLYTSQYQQALVQWQYMWLSQQQQLTGSQSLNMSSQPNQISTPALDLWMNAIDNSGQLMSPRTNSHIRRPISNHFQHTLRTPPVRTTQQTGASVDCLSVGYLRPIGRALAPFKLEHNQPVANVMLNINADIFSKLWKRTMFNLPEARHTDSQLPITFVLNCRKADGTDHKCEWPDRIELAVNGNTVNPIRKRKVQVPNKPSNVCMLVGKDRPFDLTTLLRQGTNSISIKQNVCACAYLFDISIYFQESEDLIRSRVKSKKLDITRGQRLVHKLIGVKEEEDETSTTSTAALLSATASECEPLGVDNEIECMQKSIKVSLRCPISLLRIKEPVKGVKCLHVECFDLNSYLCVNRGLAKWKCPVCSKVAISSDLLYDEYFESLLTSMGDDVTHIEYTSDSRNWMAVGFEAADDDDDGSDGEGHTSSPVSKLEPVAAAQAKRKSDVDLVNLVSDDEDETQNMGNANKRSKSDVAAEQSSKAVNRSIGSAAISAISAVSAETTALGTISVDSGKFESSANRTSLNQIDTTPRALTINTSVPRYTFKPNSLSSVTTTDFTIAGIAVPPTASPTQLAPDGQAGFERFESSSTAVSTSPRIPTSNTINREQAKANSPCSLYVPKKLPKR